MSGKNRAVAHRQPLVFGDIEAMKRKGLNQSQIADMHGVTRQAVSWQVRTYNGAKTRRQIAGEEWPWPETTRDHSRTKIYQNLRAHGEFQVTGGKGMSADKLSRLQAWWRKMEREDLVVEFDPSIPPIPGVCSHGGFAYRARTSDDGDLLIRVNEHTKLSNKGQMIWARPKMILPV